jgi:hypothetical protein
MNTAITIQPHVRKKMPPRQLLPFPWEEGKKKAESREVPAEEAMKRFLSLVERTSSIGPVKKEKNYKPK